MHILYKQFFIHAAHYLPNVPDGHPCKRLHGHRFQITLGVKDALHPVLDWVVDSHWIEERFQPFLDQLNYCLLNELPGLKNPTSEHLVLWLWEKLKPEIPMLCSVQVDETASTGVLFHASENGPSPLECSL